MKINILGAKYLEKIRDTNYTKEEISNIYMKFFKFENNELRLEYFEKYVPYDKDKIKDKIYEVYKLLKKQRGSFEKIHNFKIDEKIVEKFLRVLRLEEDILKDIEINFFIGTDTCNGFMVPNKHKVMINIALEKYIESYDFNRKISSIIIHELTHAIRFLKFNRPFKNLGDLLIEEGMACIITENIMELSKGEEDFIYPKKCFIENEEEMNKYMNLYLDYIYCEDFNLISKFMHLGDKSFNIDSGLGYYMGMEILKRYLKMTNCNITKLFYLRNEEIISYILNSER